MASLLPKALKSHKALSQLVRIASPAPAPLYSFLSTTATEGGNLPPLPTGLPPPKQAAAVDQSTERGAWSKALLFLPGVITFGLGTWQIIRRQEKIEMIEYRKNRLDMEPIPWNSISTSGEVLSSLEFRKIVCEGLLDESKNIYVGPRSRSISGITENGYYVITPLIPTSNISQSVQPPILVNRGWVPREWRNKFPKDIEDSDKPSSSDTTSTEIREESSWWKLWSKRPHPTKGQEVTVAPIKVVGVIRDSEKPSIFVPENDPRGKQWFYIDVPMIARAVGLPESTIYVEDINENVSASNPYPVPKDGNSLIRHSVMPQDHLNYTFTWYTLSAAVTFMAYKRVRASTCRR